MTRDCKRVGDPALKMNDDRPILSNVPDTSRHALQQDDLINYLLIDS